MKIFFCSPVTISDNFINQSISHQNARFKPERIQVWTVTKDEGSKDLSGEIQIYLSFFRDINGRIFLAKIIFDNNNN